MPSIEIIMLSITLCLSAGFQQGYIASVLNQPYTYINQFINETIDERFGVEIDKGTLDTVWSTLNVMFPLATIGGQFLAAWMCRRLGRRITALICCAAYIPGTLACSAALPARSWELLFVGRLLWSLANGVQSVNATVWIVEAAPKHIRGGSAALQEFSMAIGSLLCTVVGIPFSSETLWPCVFLPNIIIAVIAFGMCVWLPDSPASILEREHDEPKARAALARYYGVDADAEVLDEEFTSKKSGDKRPLIDMPDKGVLWVFNPCANVDNLARVVREAALLGVMVKVAYVFTGARALRSYSTYVIHSLSEFSLEFAQYASLGVSIIRIPITLIPVCLLDRWGRRPFLVWSLVATVASLVVLIAAILIGPQLQYVSLVAFCVLLLVNTAGLGSVSRFYGAELVPRSMLLSSMSTLTALEALTKIIVEFLFYPLANVISVWSFLMFLVPSIGFLLLVWRTCPETSNRSVQQVLNTIAARKRIDSIFPAQEQAPVKQEV